MGIPRRFNSLVTTYLVTLLISTAHGNADPAIPSSAAEFSNLTTRVLENKIVQNVRSAAENLATLAKPSSATTMPGGVDQKAAPSGGAGGGGNSVTIKDMLKMLEAQNAKFGDSCDTGAWNMHVKPIYDALYAGNTGEQNKKNDAFALAILKDHSIISKVCLSAAHIMECAAGSCQCLTKLPMDLKYASDACTKANGENRSEGGGGIQAAVMGFIHNLLSFATGDSTRCVGQIETLTVCLIGLAAHYALFKK